MRITRIAAAALGLAVAGAALAGCSSSSEPAPTSSEGAIVESADTSAITALCEQIVADAMPEADATALASAAGFTTRIGSIDGELQPTTRDYRMDRMTFEVESGIVTGCAVG